MIEQLIDTEDEAMDKELMPASESQKKVTAKARAWSRSPRGRKRSHELADLGVIASRLAHEIRNPLSTMRVQATVIQRKISKGKPADLELASEQLAAFQNEITRLEKLADAFLAYGRPPEAKPEEIHVKDFVRSLIELLEPECKTRNVDLVLQVSKSAQDAVIFMDRSQLEQVLLNLTRNANKAMENGGVLTIVLCKRGVKNIGIGVVDTGCGIAHDKMSTVFEPFFSTRHDGSGLGLAIARQIVEAAGGYIRVESELDRGSCFEVVLPLPS